VRYLKERAVTTLDDLKAASDLWGNPIPDPGTDAAIDEIYRLDGDTAHITIEGPLSLEGPDAWDRFWDYGGASYKTIQAAMGRAKNDCAVARVIFDVNSPGGILNGTDETWQAHKALAAEKPTEVHAGGLLASAAYYISAPAGKILAASPASEIGSIGVLVATYDWSKWEENIGIREVVITSSNAPDKYPDVSTDDGKDTIRARLDALERIFYSRICESRGVSTEHIAEHFGRGGLLVAQDPSTEHEDAIRVGMIDGLTTDTVEAAAGETENAPQINSVPIPSSEGNNTPAPAGTTQEGQIMDLSEFLNANPAAVAEIDKLKSEAKAAGAKEAKAEYSARVDKVLPIIQSEAYPVNIKTVACNVLAGKEDMVALTTTVTLFDSSKEAANSKAAQEQTQELGEVGAKAPNLTPAAEKELDAALKAELERRRAK
jgi:ClpP class serine protease